jgi:MFS family permease
MNVKGWGWTSLPFFLCVAFSVLWVIFMGKFFKLEQEPFSYRNILSISSFRLGLFILCVAQFVMMNSIFWGTFFQKGLGYSPFKIGLIALTFSLPTIFVSPYSGHVTDSKGFFFPIALGHSLIVIGISLMNLLVVKQLYYFLLIPMSITGAGVGLLLTSTGTLAMQEILPEQRGLFAGVYNTVRFGGAALAIAFLGSVSSYFRYEKMTKIVQQLHELYDFSVREIIDVLSGRFPLSFLGPHVSDETLSLVKQGFFSVSQEGFQFLNIIVLVLVFFSFFYSLSFFKKIKYQNLLSQKNKNS